MQLEDEAVVAVVLSAGPDCLQSDKKLPSLTADAPSHNHSTDSHKDQ